MVNSYTEPKKKDSITLSCRLDKTLYNLLQKDCKARGISLNSMINSVMKKYLSAQIRSKYQGLPTADAIIAVTAIKTRSRVVFSDDPHFKRIKEIKTKWL